MLNNIMKYALCFRGISYFENFTHTDHNSSSYNVDFSDSIQSFKDNIINPLISEGHSVDTFFTTYESKKLEYFINEINPLKVKLNPYKTLNAGTWNNVFKIIIDSLTLVKETNIKYDFIIVTRFDNYIIEKITNIFIPSNALSSISKGEDNFFVISGDIFDSVYQYLIEMQNNNHITHYYMEFCKERGIHCHKFYKSIDDQKNHPFLKTARQIFTPKNHPFHLCDIDDLFDSESPYYAFLYTPVSEFTWC